MASRLVGLVKWEGSRDRDGYREYHAWFLVGTDDTGDGPAIVMQTEGLPRPGEQWLFSSQESDSWAFCKLDTKVTIHQQKEGDPNVWWMVETTFSTKGDSKRCKDEQIDDPLLEPQKISGSFAKYQEEATHDRYGSPILNSAYEQMRGPQVEFDATRYHVKVEQNVPQLQLPLVTSMRDCLNGSTLWGVPPRCIKLTGFNWERKFYGQCSVYFVRTFEFEIRLDTFDRNLLDEGTKALNGRFDKVTGNWVLENIAGAPPNRFNPQHYQRFIDRKGNPTRVILNGQGLPAGVKVGTGTSVTDTYVSTSSNNLGQIPTGAAPWLVINPGGTPPRWDSSTFYNEGDVVYATAVSGETLGDTTTYLATDPNLGEDPRTTTGSWVVLGFGSFDVIFTPTNRGVWSPATTYAGGDYVTYTSTIGTTTAGSVFVQKYQEADFTQLNIPTQLDVSLP